MSVEQKIVAEINGVRRMEESLESAYKSMLRSGAGAGRAFMAALKVLDERVASLENLLDRAV